MKSESMTFAEAINLALYMEMESNPKLLIAGLGVNDPGRFFGTTGGLVEKFGPQRVFETPTSENGFAGIAVGAAIAGFPVINMHQRMDFFLLAMDQVVNSAAKWQFMFGDQFRVPVIFRLVVGRGWGQGPTHAQNLKAWFAHIPGLRVFEPSCPNDAFSLLSEAARGDTPTIFIEHRWLHSSFGPVNTKGDEKLTSVGLIGHGSDISLVSSGVNVSIAMQAREKLEQIGISAQVLDVRKIDDATIEEILRHVKSTRRLLVIEDSHAQASYGSEIISRVSAHHEFDLLSKPQLLAKPNYPEPTSRALLKDYYPNLESVYNRVLEILNMNQYKIDAGPAIDQPNSLFFGPF